MKKLGAIYSNKAFLVSVIVAVSFLLIFLGVRPPAFYTLQKPAVRNRATVEVQTKTTKAPFAKEAKERCVAETLPHIEINVEFAFYSPLIFPEYRINHLTIIGQLPSRAPPAFQA
jgi:hypothetical protein